MQSKFFVALSAAAAANLVAAADERVLGVYLFHRHGDRTPKSYPPSNLTALGADEAYSSGAFYRKRYVDSDASLKVAGLASDLPPTSQVSVIAPEDAVLHNSAVTFVQGLYPPTKSFSQKLANGTEVEAPLGGFQFVSVNAVSTAATANKAEDNGWLQGGSGCDNGVTSSNQYFTSSEYLKTLDETSDFYQSLLPVINNTFSAKDATFKNGYTIFDLINVAKIHNKTDIVSDETFSRLYDLASTHEWNLAYNSSSPVRAIAGSVLAGQIVDSLQNIVNGTKGASRFNAQFGAYGTFMAFFGLAQLPKASNDFYGIVDYASSMAFELVTTSTDAKPSEDDINVRFFFANGTAAQNELKQFPLFGQDKTTLSWNDFKDGMSKFAIKDTKHWCDLCGSKSSVCSAASSTGGDDGNASSQSNNGGSSGGISKAVAGVIGALVTLVVILGVQALVVLVGGLRLVKKSTLAKANRGVESSGVKGQ